MLEANESGRQTWWYRICSEMSQALAIRSLHFVPEVSRPHSGETRTSHGACARRRYHRHSRSTSGCRIKRCTSRWSGVGLRNFLPRSEGPRILRNLSLTAHQPAHCLVSVFDRHGRAPWVTCGRVSSESRRGRLLLRREVCSITHFSRIRDPSLV